MRILSFARPGRSRDALRNVLTGSRPLVERGREIVAAAADAARDVAPVEVARQGSGSRRTQQAIAGAAVVVTAAAVGAGLYLWWRQRRDEEHARLLEREPERLDPAPAASPPVRPAATQTPEPTPSWPTPPPAPERIEAEQPAIPAAAPHALAPSPSPAAAAPGRNENGYDVPPRGTQRDRGRTRSMGASMPAAPTFAAPKMRRDLPPGRRPPGMPR